MGRYWLLLLPMKVILLKMMKKIFHKFLGYREHVLALLTESLSLGNLH